jgi:hypothetical protein
VGFAEEVGLQVSVCGEVDGREGNCMVKHVRHGFADVD